MMTDTSPQRLEPASEPAALDTLALPASGNPLSVFNPATGEKIGELPQQTSSDLPAVLSRAAAGAVTARGLSRHQRAAILDGAATRLRDRAEDIALLIVQEAGKTIRQAKKEVSRAANTLALSAAEARRNAGEVIPFDAYEGSENRTGWYSREPLGIIAAITPYNDALNLVAHKIGPALAGGNAVILKPAQQTPFTARLLVALLTEAGLPEEVVTTVHGDRHLAQGIVSAREVRMVSFTGGFRTGEAIAATAGIKRLSMELGGNAPVLIFADADLNAAAEACVSGAFWAAGQNCIGTQRILIHRDAYPAFRTAFLSRAAELVTGDPTQEVSDVGPMISAERAEAAWLTTTEAVAAGATLLLGSAPRGAFLSPAVLEGVPHDSPAWAEEVFAPVCTLEAFDSYEEAVELANRSEYALHAGVFTRDLSTAMRASRDLDAGGVMINDSSDYRFDAMPFGGAKYGSMGREGVRFAYEEMTQPKVVCLTE